MPREFDPKGYADRGGRRGEKPNRPFIDLKTYEQASLEYAHILALLQDQKNQKKPTEEK